MEALEKTIITLVVLAILGMILVFILVITAP